MESVPPEREDRPLTFLAAAGWTLLVKLLFEVSVGLLEAARPGALTDLVTVTAARVLAVSFVLFVLLRVHEPEASVRSVLAFRRAPVLAILGAVVAGAALALPASWIGSAVAEHLPKPEESEVYNKLLSADTPARRAVLVASLVFVMPISDELLFRGALFSPLERQHPPNLVVLSAAACDALLNFNPRGFLSFALVLLAFGWMRSVTGSVLPSLVARVAFFAVLIVPEALGRPDPPTTPGVLAGAIVAAALALVLVAIASRGARARAVAGDRSDGSGDDDG